MSFDAAYISANSFGVSGDQTSSFVPGRTLICDCGVDGFKYCFIDYSSYSSSTTVYTVASESDALTSSLSAVAFSSVKPDSLSTGNMPLESAMMLRGFRSGMATSYKDGSSFYVGVGSIHINNGTYDRIYHVPSRLTKSVTGLTASTWYYVYCNPPSNGLALTATEITYSTSVPSVSDSKGGKLYHPTDGTKRCIGWVYSGASSTLTTSVAEMAPGRLYGTSDPPSPTGLPDGTIYLKYAG